MADAVAWVHASCVAVDGAGILIRGASGSGKSSLALLLLDRVDAARGNAGLVGDDRVGLTREGERILARPHPALGSRIEVRGLGLVPAAKTLTDAPVHLVVDLVEACPRLPDAPMQGVTLLGFARPGLVLDRAMLRAGLGPRLVLDALAGCPGVARMPQDPVLFLSPATEP
ncbi:HPr kinase/phosphorylase [Methylobacterium goesingense]|uniref:Serine kinase of HPr protein (Carbohydrate metabolism regulator) n=1 Tax=Methylobacterium goesingense TaxID=243690 RepID=A0ABV2L5H4_9HYPH|nr:HPr kinase/phosphatase C-terminal domain-containing protein [Methylobacterium goesingense]GJD72377.1 HPr kinase/phosphorylase [Methylobacterium goesingense]